MAKKDKSLIIRIDDDTLATLKELAKKSKRSSSDYIRLIIEYANSNDIKI